MTGARRPTTTRVASPTPTVTPARTRAWSSVRTVAVTAGGLAALVTAAIVGTGASAGPGVPAPTVAASTAHAAPRDDAATLLARGDYAGAEAAYRERVRSTPRDVQARYGLGIALSHLDRAAETIEQFEWIVANAAPGRKEVTEARHWLDAATRSTETRDEARPADAAAAAAAATGSLKGVTQWPGITPETKRTKLELRVVGDEPALEGTNVKLYISLGAPYRFTKLRPGRYRLVGRTDTQELWNTKVVVETGVETPLDLTPQNSAVIPDPVAKS